MSFGCGATYRYNLSSMFVTNYLAPFIELSLLSLWISNATCHVWSLFMCGSVSRLTILFRWFWVCFWANTTLSQLLLLCNQIRQISRSVVSNSLRPHESQHARPPCPSPTPGVHSDSRPSSWWCYPAISSSVIPFSSCPQSLPASESFPVSQLFASGGQSTGVSALASFLPKKSQGWSPLEWTGCISLQSRDSQESSPTPQFKSINSLALSLLHSPILTSIHDHRKNHSLD